MSVLTTENARYMILSLEFPGAGRMNAGVLLEDPATDRLWVRLRRDWDQFAPEEAEVLSAIEYDLASKAREMGATHLLKYLEDTLSNSVQVTDRRALPVEDFERALGRLYREHVVDGASVRDASTSLLAGGGGGEISGESGSLRRWLGRDAG